jgi:hypothetical protein
MRRLDQVAFYCVDKLASDELKADLCLEKAEWIADTVTANSKIVTADNRVVEGINVAELEFCYKLGCELEIICYKSGPHWHPTPFPGRKFFSHVGVHLDDGEAFPLMHHSRIVQETFTISHTSEYLTTGPGAGRKYHYRIHKVGPGTYVKYIRRVYPK